jgi:hypothetical protein
MDVGGCRNGASLFEEAQCGGHLGTAPLLGTQEYILRLLLLEPEYIKNVSLGALELW